MKKIYTIIIIAFIAQVAIAQEFSAPSNFTVEHNYIDIDHDAYDCEGNPIPNGGANITRFNWDKPDLTSTNATLEFYTIYNEHEGNVVTVTVTQETYYCIETGFEGILYVKATYSNPEGESEMSNIVEASGFALGIKSNDLSQDIKLIFDKEAGILKVDNNTKPVKNILLYDLNGRKILDNQNPNNYITTNKLTIGTYIVSVVFQDGRLQNVKFVLQ